VRSDQCIIDFCSHCRCVLLGLSQWGIGKETKIKAASFWQLTAKHLLEQFYYNTFLSDGHCLGAHRQRPERASLPPVPDWFGLLTMDIKPSEKR